MQMNAIQKSTAFSAQERAYQFLKGGVINLDFKPNQRLRAQEIATQLELSRTPVREAFGRLEQEQLIIKESGWGYAVKPMTVKEALNVYRVREALEVETIKEVIPKVTNDLILCLEIHLQRAEEYYQKRRMKDYRSCTRSFYWELIRATDNNVLEYMYSLIDDRVRLLGAMITERHFSRPRESLVGNKAILEGIKARDEAATEAAVRLHVSGSRQAFLTHVMSETDPLLR